MRASLHPGLHLGARLPTPDNALISALARPNALPAWRRWVRWFRARRMAEATVAMARVGFCKHGHTRRQLF